MRAFLVDVENGTAGAMKTRQTRQQQQQQKREEKRREDIKESLRQLQALWGKTPCTPKK